MGLSMIESEPLRCQPTMQSFQGWIEEMRDLETDESRMFMSDEFGPLLRLSLLVPNFERPALYLTTMAILFPLSLIQGLLFGYSAILLVDDFNSCVFTLHLCLLIMIGLAVFVHINMSRRCFYTVATTMATGFYDYAEIPHPDLPMIQKELTREKYLMVVAPMAVGLVVLLIMCAPWIDEYLGVNSDEIYTDAGVNMKLLIPCYYPFPTHKGVPYLLAQVFQVTAVSFVGVVIGCADFLYVIASLKLVFQLRILILSLQTIDKRAKTMCAKNGENLRKGAYKDSDSYKACLDYCLGQNVAHHKIIKRSIDGYNDVAGYPVLFAYSVGTLVIALSMYSLAQASTGFKTQNLTFFATALAEIFNMFMLSYYGEKLGILSDDLYNEIYFMNWPKYHKKFVNSLMIFHVGAKKSLVMTAGGLVQCNMETFSSVMNSAYTYFNLLNAANSN